MRLKVLAVALALVTTPRGLHLRRTDGDLHQRLWRAQRRRLPAAGDPCLQGAGEISPANSALSTPDEAPGTIIVDTGAKHLYYMLPGGKAVRYGIGVGREGFEWSGTARVG